MSETTEILFNSPALHSLKRDQLVKLCKIHSIKANGKNVDLIKRLKQKAGTLPKDDPLSIAARSETESDSSSVAESPSPTKRENRSAVVPEEDAEVTKNPLSRMSEQWELVMESIPEVDETGSSQGTISHRSGEFGTGGSKSVGSSLKAIATSLGLKRNTHGKHPSIGSSSSKSSSKPPSTTHEPNSESTPQLTADELALTQHSFPHSSANPGFISLNDDSPSAAAPGKYKRMSTEPLPGCSSRPGIPAPSEARLSMGYGFGAVSTPMKQQPTTTIRLVSNPSTNNTGLSGENIFQTPRLKPFTTSFDLLMSPGGPSTSRNAGNFWAPEKRNCETLYPTLAANDLAPGGPSSPNKPSDLDMDTDTDKVDVNDTGNNNINNNGNGNGEGEGNASGNVPENGISTLNAAAMIMASQTPTRSRSHSKSNSLSSHKSPSPFIFGSPDPKHNVSNDEFRSAASSVLEEMNKRLQASGVQGLSSDIISNLNPGMHTKEDVEKMQRDVKPLPLRLSGVGSGKGEITKKFDDVHDAEFQKMEGIDGLVKRKMEKVEIGKKRKSSVLNEDNTSNLGLGGNGPRRPKTGPGAVKNLGMGVRVGSKGSIGGGRTSGLTRVISNGRRGMAIPGGFGDDDNIEEDDNMDGVEEGEGVMMTVDEERERGGKRIKIDPEAQTQTQAQDKKNKEGEENDVDMEVDNQTEDQKVEEGKRERERQVIKRKLEMSRAKRRSSAVGVGAAAAAARRKSAARASAVNANGAKAKAAGRFAFLTSAKNLVTSVWNRGKPTAAPPTTTTRVPASSTMPNKDKAGTSAAATAKKPMVSKKASTTGFAPTRSVNGATNSGSMVNGNGTAGAGGSRLSVAQNQGQGLKASASLGRSRSPIPPSFTFNLGTTGTGVNGHKRTGSNSSVASSRMGSGTAGVSVKSRMSTVTGAGVGSMGAKVGSGSGSGSGAPTVASRLSTMGSSRLFAPTASSLAKMKKPESFSNSNPTTATTTATTTTATAATTSNMGNTNGIAARPSTATSMGGVGGGIGKKKKASLLGAITNSPKVQMHRRGTSGGTIGFGVSSPRISQQPQRQLHTILSPTPTSSNANALATPGPGKIFSKPIMNLRGSSIPVLASLPSKGVDEEGNKVAGATATTASDTGSIPFKQRSLTGRKPRISRSKIIARLASQREAAASSPSSGVHGTTNTNDKADANKQPIGHAGNGTGTMRIASGSGIMKARVPSGGGFRPRRRTRSSVGAGVKGSIGSGASIKGRVVSAGGKERNVLASAKRRVRQSEVARRRSRVSGGSGVGIGIGADS